MRPAVTRDEKVLVKHLSKKSKMKGKGTNVYFNRKNTDGSSRYLTGKFYSNKNAKQVIYRSSYELRYFHLLESDPKVKSYEVESVKIPYICPEKKYKNYIPDVIVLYTNGDMEICEIKPKAMLDNLVVKLKAQACRVYFHNLLKKSDIVFRYRFITEADLFKDSKDYLEFIKTHS